MGFGAPEGPKNPKPPKKKSIRGHLSNVKNPFLYKKAALLRNTTFKFPEKVIGKNTKTNLQSGIMYGAVDSVEGMIKRIQNEVKFKISEVILTGGFSTIISPGLSIKHRIEKFLTLYGIYLISKIK